MLQYILTENLNPEFESSLVFVTPAALRLSHIYMIGRHTHCTFQEINFSSSCSFVANRVHLRLLCLPALFETVAELRGV